MSSRPMTTGDEPTDLVDHGFMDARSKLIDLAAFLDRVDRHGQAGDFRVVALRRAIGELSAEVPERARRVLESFSDPTTEPVESAGGQGAFGAWPGAADATAPAVVVPGGAESERAS